MLTSSELKPLEQRRAQFTDALKAASPYDIDELKQLRADLAAEYHTGGPDWWQLMIESRLVGALVDLMEQPVVSQHSPWWRK